MTRFADKSFTVKTGARDPKACDHHWQRVDLRTKRQVCVQCGAEIPETICASCQKPFAAHGQPHEWDNFNRPSCPTPSATGTWRPQPRG